MASILRDDFEMFKAKVQIFYPVVFTLQSKNFALDNRIFIKRDFIAPVEAWSPIYLFLLAL